MRAGLFSFLVLVTFAATIAAWHWRNGRLAAGERLHRALAVRTTPAVAPVGPAATPTAAPAPAPAKPKETAAARAEFDTAMLPGSSEARRARNPRLAELHRKQLRLDLLLKNGAFLRSRNLPDADRERLLAAWITNELDQQEVRVVGREMGLAISDPALIEAFGAARQRMQEAETAVLGKEGVAALTGYRQGQGIRDAVMNLQGEAALAGHPLTLEQADTVAAVLVNSGDRPGRSARYLNQVNPATAERLLAGVLSPEQSELLLLPLRGSIASSKFTNLVRTIGQREADGAAAP